MLSISRVAKVMQRVLETKANELARSSGFMERERKVTGASFIKGLVLGWINDPQASLAGLSQSMGNAGTPLSRQGVNQRLCAKSVNFLEQILKESLQVAVKAMPVSQNLLARFESVELRDASTITLPNELTEIWQGSGGFGDNASISAIKLCVAWDVKNGQLKHLDLQDGTCHEKQSASHQHQLEAGALQIEDLAYFGLDDLEAVAQQGAFFLSRYKLGTWICDEARQKLDLDELLPAQVGDSLDCDIHLGKDKQLPCRLVAERVPLAVWRQRQERLQETARQNQTVVSDRAIHMAQWTIYITNVPCDLLATQEVFVLGRYRWQIELLFKLWKSELQIDKWQTHKAERILCELYAKLIGAVVSHWLLLVACWHQPRRSLRQAMHSVRGAAWQCANSLSDSYLLKHALESLCRAVSSCRMDKSQTQPRAFQLLEACIA